MKKIILLSLSLMVFLGDFSLEASVPAPLKTEKGDEKTKKAQLKQVIRGIQGYYKTLRSFEMEFKQKTRYKGFKQELKGQGRLKVNGLGDMKMAFFRPENKVIGSNNDYFYLWNGEFKQGYRIKNQKDLSLPVALTFLWGKGDPTLRYDLSLVTFKSVDNNKYYNLQFLPKASETPFYEKFYILANKSDYKINKAILYTSKGSIVFFEFPKTPGKKVFSQKDFGLPYHGSKKRWKSFDNSKDFLKTILQK